MDWETGDGFESNWMSTGEDFESSMKAGQERGTNFYKKGA